MGIIVAATDGLVVGNGVGDGVGAEIVSAAQKVVDAAVSGGNSITWTELDG